MKLAALAAAALLALTASASADPATLGSLIISAFLAVGAGGLLPAASAAAIGWGAIGVGLVAANFATSLLFKGPSANPQSLKNTVKGGEGPGRYATGRVELAAKVNFGGTAGYDIYRWLLHCFGPVDGIELYKYGGVEITVEPNGDVSTPPFAVIGGSHLNVQTKPGDGSETAWPELIAAFPALFDADCRARGLAATLLRMINPGTGHPKFQKLLQGGIREFKAQMRVGAFYDPRDEQTRWTMNGVLQCLHWMRQLPGMRDELIDIAGAAAVADAADALVPTLGGTRPRCQMSGGWEGPLTYDIFADMLRSTGLEVRRTADRKYALAFVEDDPASELTLTKAHIIDNHPQAGPEGAKRPNFAKLRYFSPERGFEVAEVGLHESDVGTGEYLGADWARVPAEIERVGEQEMPVELVFCPDAGQGQVITRREFHMGRADSGILKTRLAGRAAWGKKVITIEIPDVGEDGGSIFVKVRKGPMRIYDQEGYCEIPYQIIPDILKTPWNAASDEVPPPPVLPVQQTESDLETPVAPAEATVVQYLGGAYETRVRFAFVPGGILAEAVYREYAGGVSGPFQSMSEYNSDLSPGVVAYGYIADNTVGERVEFKVRWWDDVLTPENGSRFSPLLDVPAMAIDNTQPSALVLVNDSGTLEVSTTQLRVVQIRIEHQPPAGSYSTLASWDVRPGLIYEQPISPSGAGTHNYRAYAKTSSGTDSAVSNIISVVV